MRASAPALVATLHDPPGAALTLLDLEPVATALGTYPLVVVATTPATDARLTTRLQQRGAHVVPGGQAGESRRASLMAAGADQPAYFSCDFDRWLHWARFWPDELAALPARVARLAIGKRFSPWYVCLGRTARAFATHPAAQRLPEAATNRALSVTAGRPLDAVAGAAWLTPEAAEIVLAGSREPTAATDLEWAALILRHDPGRIRGLRCDGLEWETPDFHAAEIMTAGGLAAWTRATFDTPTMWAARLRLAAASGAALERVLSEEPVRQVTGVLPPLPAHRERVGVRVVWARGARASGSSEVQHLHHLCQVRQVRQLQSHPQHPTLPHRQVPRA